MPQVRFTRHLVRFFPTLTENTRAAGSTVAEVLADLDRQFPGLAAYVIDETGALRRHVNIFLGEELIHDRERLGDAVEPDSHLFIFQALSGGILSPSLEAQP